MNQKENKKRIWFICIAVCIGLLISASVFLGADNTPTEPSVEVSGTNYAVSEATEIISAAVEQTAEAEQTESSVTENREEIEETQTGLDQTTEPFYVF